MNTILVRNSIRRFYFQPSLLIMMVLELFVLLLFIFTVHLLFEDGMLVGMTVIGSKTEMSVSFIQQFASNSAALIRTILMFLFILGGSAFFSELYVDPLLGIVLTKPLSRLKLISSHYVGGALAVLTNLMLFTVSICLIIYFKSTGAILFFPFIGVLSLWVQILFILALAALLSLLLENSMAVMVISVAVYYVLAPLVTNPSGTYLFLRKILFYAVPIGGLNQSSNALLSGGNVSLMDFVAVLVVSILYFGSACILFQRKDIQ